MGLMAYTMDMRFWYVAAFMVFLPVGSVFADETIPAFDAVITVSHDATIHVTEHITYDFGTAQKHGIFRTIPYSYQAGTETYTAPITNVSVTDGEGVPIQFGESKGDGALTLKIGDPETLITGTHRYIVSYTVEGPFLYFDDHDELYWNVTGAWNNGIATATALINLPPGAKVNDAACYQGASGSARRCDADEKLVNAQQAGYHAIAKNLNVKEGLTIAVSFPKGTIAVIEKPWNIETRHWYDYSPLALPVIVFIWLGYVWYTRGRDPKGRGTIVPEYAPPEHITPSVAGVVYNESIEPREITAEIIRLAVEGHIRIHRIETSILIFTTTDYLLERLPGVAEPEDHVGKLILERLFKPTYSGTATIDGREVSGTLLSKMRRTFVQDRDAITDAMYEAVLDEGYFVERPDKVRTVYVSASLAVCIAGIITLVNATAFLGTMFGIALIASGLCGCMWGWLMPARTAEGVRVKEQLEGFKRYLEVAEKDRLAFHNAPERTPKLFDAYLPFAMAFGVEESWARQFEGIYAQQPSWYTGNPGAPFAVAAFTHDMRTFSTDFAAASAPQSSGVGGGGSVGGGFGGGGGGSW